jgi:hypothetical protein
VARGKLQAPPSNLRADLASRASQSSSVMAAQEMVKKARRVKQSYCNQTRVTLSLIRIVKGSGVSEYSPTGWTEYVRRETEVDQHILITVVTPRYLRVGIRSRSHYMNP